MKCSRDLDQATVDPFEKAIRLGREAIPARPEDHLGPAYLLNNLRDIFYSKHLSTRAVGDLEEAISLVRRAIEAIPWDNQNQWRLGTRAEYLSRLGSRLCERHCKAGAIADPDEAVQIQHEAIRQTPGGHENLSRHLYHLAVMLHERYSRTGARNDLDEARRVGCEAI